ncbi:sensor histidine kinase [Haloferula chungangensis]|uniref:histidine kinase n=1 Tax=Haloferula chungangensis TaxID=1048331 RepID=A0ABW2L5N1_9BACT
MSAASPSLRWLYLAVLGPLVVLAVLAWWGTRSQLKAAWADAQADAERLAPGIAKVLALDFSQQIDEIPSYPNPPIPGPPAPPDDPLLGNDTEALFELSIDPEAGLSPAGLPRRALAALRLHELDPSHPLSSYLFLYEAPSILTPLALEKITDDEFALANWKRAEAVRKLAAEHPSEEGVWLLDDLPVYLRNEGSKITYYTLPTRDFDGLEREQELPNWVHVQFSLDQESPPASPLATTSVPFGKGLELHIIPRSEILEAPIRRQQQWTLAILSAAIGTALIALYVIHRTVTRERRLAELKSQFVASVSHELRAPLGSIRLMAESLQQGRVSKPAEFHTLIAREGARLSHLIENVLDFARIEEDRKQYHFEECDLSALLRDTLRLMQPLAEDRRVQLAFDIPDLTATVDPSALQQALVNLVDNAIKFSPVRGVVDLRAKSGEDGRITISIIDQGPGIPKSEQKNIFQRFHRLGNELRRETQGTGIGLSIVKHIAEAHGGSITVESTPPNGATFTLTIPAQTPDN